MVRATTQRIQPPGGADHMNEHENSAQQWAPSKWWRAVGPDGSLWCETSNYDELMRIKRPDDVVQRLWERHDAEWRNWSGPTNELDDESIGAP